MRAIVLDYPPVRPYTVESDALVAAGGSPLEAISLDELRNGRLRADTVVNAGNYPLDEELLDHLDGCRCLIGYGVGVDWIELDAATRRGIAVVNNPLANVEDVAVHTVALLLACARRLPEYDRHIRAGGFRPSGWRALHRLSTQTLGLLAFGNIARRVVPLAAPFGLRIVAWDPYVPAATMRALGVEPVEADELLRSADIVSVHLPATPETRGFLDARRLALLGPDAILIVTSRGAVYDSEALAAALAEGCLAAAGLDVFPEEPLPPGHALTRLPNAILTPHLAGYTEESDADARRAVGAALAALARGETPANVLNPEAFRAAG